MKIQSTFPNVFFEAWQTPVMDSEQLWLLTALNMKAEHYLFFQKNFDDHVNIHVLHIDERSPFRITDEGCGYSCVADKYLKHKYPEKLPKNYEGSRTRKLWNTEFMIDTNTVNSSACQYLIRTQDHWIEFIAFKEPKWAIFQNKSLKDLVAFYLEKSQIKRARYK